MITLSLLTTATLLGAQDVRVSSGIYHAMADVRQPAPAALSAPESPSPRSALGVRTTAPGASAVERTAAASVAHQSVPPSLQFDVDAEGRHWARGANYKASFGPEGASFVPFTGSHAPRNFPVQFAPASAQQGGAVAALGAPVITRTGERIVLDQGAVRSEYVLGLGGVEQLFVFDAPLGSGDLVLDVALETELSARVDGPGWLFENEYGAVSYGGAFVLDARGQKLDIATIHTGEALRFTIPAVFLAGAAWPIAIDPLLTNVTVDTAAIDQLEVDVAYDPTTNQYLVAFAEVFSATDHDIHSWLVDTAGNVDAGSGRYFDLSSLNRTRPRVALTDIRRAFLCAYVDGATGSARRIGARPRNADTSNIGSAFIVDDNSATDRLEADICGDAYTGSINDAHYTVVWRRYWNAGDSDVIARVVNEDGTFVSGELFVTNFTNVSDDQPSISKCITPGANDSIVVWRRGSGVHASAISYDGAAVRSEFVLKSTLAPPSNPQVSGLAPTSFPGSADRTFVACWDTDQVTDRDIEAVVASATSNSAAAPVVSGIQNITFMEHVDYLLDQREPDVACMGDRWVISQNAVYPGFTDYVIRATTVNIVGTGLGISERFVALTQTLDETLKPKTASQYESGEVGSNDAFTGWIQQSTLGQPGDVYGATHAASTTNTCAAQFVFCFGNTNGTFADSRAFLWVEGDFSTTGTKRLHALDVHANAFGYFLTSLTTSGPVTPPGSAGVLCLGGSIGRYSNFVLNSGAGAAFSLDIDPTVISQPTGPVPALSGQTWFFQAWHRDVPFGGGAATSNFTNAAGVPFQ
jgi:hypothetical protein